MKEKAKKYFESSLAGEGGSFQFNRLMWAVKYAVAVQDKELFVRLLETVRDSADTLSEQKLANAVARKKAVKLLEKTNDLFE